MAFVKFLFVLTLAVPLAEFMIYYINKLLDEFKDNILKEKTKSMPVKRKTAEKNRRKNYGERDDLIYKNNEYRNGENTKYTGGSAEPGYDSVRRNFDNSRMKKRYEESLKKYTNESEIENSPEKGQAEDNPLNKPKSKSKRKRRKERKNKKRVRE